MFFIVLVLLMFNMLLAIVFDTYSEVRSLVERFDIESYSDFSAKSSNFRGLVLRCIKADFCDQILIFQHFARSRRYAILCTAQISKFQQKVGKRFLMTTRSLILDP